MLFRLRNSSRFDAADHSRRRRGKERRHSYGNKNACRRQADRHQRTDGKRTNERADTAHAHGPADAGRPDCGTAKGHPVIAAPGCARSPKENGLNTHTEALEPMAGALWTSYDTSFPAIWVEAMKRRSRAGGEPTV